MPIKAFRIDYALPTELDFARVYLASGDFNQTMLKEICQKCGISTHFNPQGGRTDAINQIADLAVRHYDVRKHIIIELLKRNRNFMAVKGARTNISIPSKPQYDPTELTISVGDGKWYGQLHHPNDKPGAIWYVRPNRITNEFRDEKGNLHQGKIRWLCFARIYGKTVSLHWQGFSKEITIDGVLREIQYDYWEQISRLWTELENTLNLSLDPINWEDFVLYNLWDQYRYDDNYVWTDRAIRADSGGVNLSASSRAEWKKNKTKDEEKEDLDIKGIRRLAHSIRSSVQTEYELRNDERFPEAADYDEVILRTLLREFGTISYEFSIIKADTYLLCLHCFFGRRKGRDSIPHLKVIYGKASVLEQIWFLETHLSKFQWNQ